VSCKQSKLGAPEKKNPEGTVAAASEFQPALIPAPFARSVSSATAPRLWNYFDLMNEKEGFIVNLHEKMGGCRTIDQIV
jgi:hypothetical protein